MKTTLILSALVMVFAPLYCAAADGEKQPVFLLCPHKEHYSSWSVYVLADKADPSKALAIGLESLKKKNSKDSSYEAVLADQNNPATVREDLGQLDAAQFGAGAIEVKENDALRISVNPSQDGLHLQLSMRIAADQRFDIGGKEQNKRDVVLHYDKAVKKWVACADKLQDAEGAQVVAAGCQEISGLAFPVTGTGIYRIVGVVEGRPVILLDR